MKTTIITAALVALFATTAHAEIGYSSSLTRLETYLVKDGHLDLSHPDAVEYVNKPAGIELTGNVVMKGKQGNETPLLHHSTQMIVRPVDLKLALATIPERVLRKPLPTKK